MRRPMVRIGGMLAAGTACMKLTAERFFPDSVAAGAFSRAGFLLLIAGAASAAFSAGFLSAAAERCARIFPGEEEDAGKGKKPAKERSGSPGSAGIRSISGGIRGQKTAFLQAAVPFLTGAILCFSQMADEKAMTQWAGREVTWEGRVEACRKTETGRQLTVRRMEEGAKGGKGALFLTVISEYGGNAPETLPPVCEGRLIRVSGKAELPQPARNPGTFDYRKFLAGKNIRIIVYAEAGGVAFGPRAPGIGSRILFGAAAVRNRVKEALEETMDPGSAGLVMGILFGEKEGVGENLMEIFRKNGTAHILAVSGIHAGMVYLFLSRFVFRKKSAPQDMMILLFLAGYAAAARFSPSVVRAVLMILLHMASRRLHFRYDLMSASFAAAVPLMILRPMILFEAGFQMSFLAVLLLGGVFPAARKRIGDALAAPLILQTGMIPLTARLFNYVSFSSFAANFPVLFLGGMLIPLALLFCLCAAVPGPAFFEESLAASMKLILRGMEAVNRALYVPGKSFLPAAGPGLPFLALFYGFLFFGTSETIRILKARKKWRLLAVSAAALVLCSAALPAIAPGPFSKAGLIFVDVGQGDCLHIRTKEGKHLLIDGGGSRRKDVGEKILMPYLLKNGASGIDAAIVTHWHLDHAGGIASLARKGMIRKLYLYEEYRRAEEAVLAETGLKKSQIGYLSAGRTLRAGRETVLEVLWPLRPQNAGESEENLQKPRGGGESPVLYGEDENRRSLVIRVRSGGVSVMMTADIDKETEAALLSAAGYARDAGREDSLPARRAGTGGGLEERTCGKEGIQEEREARNAAERLFRCDILKVAHHGSRGSTGDLFLEAVSPQIAVIQTGKNNFGHPAPAVIEKLRENGIMTYRNDMDGAVGVVSEKRKGKENRIRILTMIPRKQIKPPDDRKSTGNIL